MDFHGLSRFPVEEPPVSHESHRGPRHFRGKDLRPGHQSRHLRRPVRGPLYRGVGVHRSQRLFHLESHVLRGGRGAPRSRGHRPGGEALRLQVHPPFRGGDRHGRPGDADHGHPFRRGGITPHDRRNLHGSPDQLSRAGGGPGGHGREPGRHHRLLRGLPLRGHGCGALCPLIPAIFGIDVAKEKEKLAAEKKDPFPGGGQSARISRLLPALLRLLHPRGTILGRVSVPLGGLGSIALGTTGGALLFALGAGSFERIGPSP